jgi:uncharacterized protein
VSAAGFGPTRLIVLQPTAFCNIDCRYCYLPDRTNRSRMTPETVERALTRVFRYPTMDSSVLLEWHSGEPLSVGVAQFAALLEAVERARPAALQVEQIIQTNATLIDPQWCALFKQWGITIGVSIDGPARFHDAHRKQRNGAGTFAAAMRGVALLREADVPFSVIVVLTEDSIAEPEALFDFFAEHEMFDIGFNIEETEGAHTNDDRARAALPQAYKSFLTRFIARAAETGAPFHVREFESALARMTQSGARNDQVEPLGIISIDVSGRLSTFSPELLGMSHPAYGDFAFGNACDEAFETIRARIGASDAYRDIQAGRSACAAHCGYFQICGGGAPSNKLYENGGFTTTDTLYCRAIVQASADVAMRALDLLPPSPG